MGCVSSSSSSAKTYAQNERKLSRTIQEDLQRARKNSKQIKRLVLLGPTRSGKSTVFHQLSQIHNEGEIKSSGDLVAINGKYIQQCSVIQMQNLVQACLNEFRYTLEKEAQNAANMIRDKKAVENCTTTTVGEQIGLLWKDSAIQETFKNRDQLSNSVDVTDNCDYFFNNISRISQEGYEPTEKDILFTHKPTTEIITIKFEQENTQFEIADVGGLTSERRKWFHYFDNVDAVIFVASLSCYNQFIYNHDYGSDNINISHGYIYAGDKSTKPSTSTHSGQSGYSNNNSISSTRINALIESINVFDQVLNDKSYVKTNMILFLNKKELFDKKIVEYPLTVCFGDYDEGLPNDSDNCIEYIKKQFESKNSNKNKQIYIHVTCATDKDNIRKIFNDVQHIIVKTSLVRSGLI